MRKITISNLAYSLLVVAILLAFWFLFFGGYFSGDAQYPAPDKAKEIQPFITGLVVPLLTLGSTLLIIANLRSNTIQNFSNNFFKLIDQHHKLVDNLASAVEGISTEEKPSTKRDFFDDLSTRIALDFEILSTTQELEEDFDKILAAQCKGKTSKDLLMCIYDHYFHIHLSDLSHYFRNLFHMVMFVERSVIRENRKKEFIQMLRAQLSNYELLLLAYNGMHEYGTKFYPLLEKYELLKNLNNERRVPLSYEKRIVDTGILTEQYPHLKLYWAEKEKGATTPL